VDDGQQQGAVGAGLDGHPLVGYRRVAGADGVDGDELAALALEVANGDLEGIGVVVLGGADHDEQLGAVQVGAAKLPEGAANGVDESRRQIDGTEAAVSGVVGGAELLGEEAGEGLHLVATSEEGEALGVGGAQVGQALGEEGEGLLPGDRFEVGGATQGAGATAQGLGEPRRRVLLHDPRGTLGTDDALVEGVVRVTLDVAHLAIPKMDADAAAAGAHVTGGLLDLGAANGAIGNGFLHGETCVGVGRGGIRSILILSIADKQSEPREV
jgi:hypothetical protein